MAVADPLDAPQWKRIYAFCGQCWERRSLWVKGNVGYCEECRPDWKPGARMGARIDGEADG